MTKQMTYGAETWALTTQTKNKLAAAQTKMDRRMLNITYREGKANIWVREKQRSQTGLDKSEDGSGPGQDKSTLERRTRRLMEGYHLAEDSAR